MKTSSKLIISALVLLFIGLTAYNLDLKASYLSGDYKKPFHGFEFVAMSDIREIDVQTANLLNIKIEKGEKEGIWIREKYKDQLSWSKKGRLLQVGLNQEGIDRESWWFEEAMVIIVKDLGKVAAEGLASKAYAFGNIRIAGLAQASLELQASGQAELTLVSSKITHLTAKLSSTQSAAAKLEIGADNNIGEADFIVPGEGNINLNNPNIGKTRYQLSDKATVVLSGKALNNLAK